MRKMKFTLSCSAAAILAACALGACGSSTAATTAAPAETSAAETTAAGETQAAGAEVPETSAAAQTLSPDAIKILAIDPKVPDFGSVKLGDFSGIEITAPIKQEITEEDIDTYITDYIFADQTKEVDEAAKEGDTVNIDFVGKLDGEAFDGGTGEAYDLKLGSGQFIEGFEDGLIGAKKGEKRSLDLTFPEDYNAEDLAGKAVVFDVTVNAVKRPMTAEDLTDEVANEYSSGEYKTVQEYRDGVREALEVSANALAKGELYTNAINAAASLSETDISDAAIDWEMDIYLQNYDKSLKSSYGFGLADLLGMYGQDYDGFRATLEEGARVSAQKAAIVHEIAEQEGLVYNDATLKQYLDEYGYSEDLVKDNTSPAWLEETVIQYLVGKHLSDNAKVSYIPYEEYEAQAMAELEAAQAETGADADAADAAEDAGTAAGAGAAAEAESESAAK